MEKIWKAHWPPGLDEARIRLPGEPLPSRAMFPGTSGRGWLPFEAWVETGAVCPAG